MSNVYSVGEYWSMLADQGRRDAYAEALRRTVTPESVVLNIGAGTGVFALQACQFGARRVYAVEPDDIIGVARQLAAANGFTDRIEFHQELSTDISLPEPVDIIVSDLRGVLPLHEHHIAAIRDARRFLAPGGLFIPERDEIRAALIEVPELYQQLIVPWTGHTEDIDFDAARTFATNRWAKVRVAPNQLLTAPQTWVTLDYPRVEDTNFSGELRWRIERPGTVHGLCAWFVATLTDGVTFSTGPEAPERIYGSGFFPLSEPAPVSPGDTVMVALSATLLGDGYLWRWTTRVENADGSTRVSHDQTNLSAASAAAMRMSRPDATPGRTEQGDIDLEILTALDGRTTVRAIAEGLTSRHPEMFGDVERAVRRVQRVVRSRGR